MKAGIRKYILAVLALTMLGIGSAVAGTFGDFGYTVTSNNTVTITNYTGSGGSVTIPSTIESNDVTGIGEQAFYSCSSLTNVTIPNSVLTIGFEAFSDCSGLNYVTFGNGMANVGVAAFSGCTGLTGVTIDSSITNIGTFAFQNCTGLTSIVIGNCSTNIENSVTTIGSIAFSGCSGLTNVTFGSRVASIGIAAFSNCTGLTSMVIPENVINIGDYAFSSCSGLQHLYLTGDAPNIGGTNVFDATPATLYYLPNTTGWFSPLAGRPAVLWNPEFTTLSFNAGNVSCTVTGSVDIPVAMEVSTNLISGQWQRLSTTNLAGGSMEFIDPSGGNPSRFYRMVGY